ncbi:MAG: magnesium transporter [Tissierellia bacterium]|nr:magnesium transporter [Tissierellia bacterium]
MKIQERDIIRLIDEKKLAELKGYLSEMNPVDLADIIDDLDNKNSLIVIRLLPKELGVEVFSYFDVDKQKEIATMISDSELKYILDQLYFDDMIDLLEEMPAELVADILKNAPYSQRKLINEFLKYPEDSAGSIMTIEYVDLKEEMTVEDAIDHIRDIGMTKETVYTCYVTNASAKLVGIVSLRKLVTEDTSKRIGDIMQTDIITVNTHDDQEEVAEVFKKYDFLAIPVVDKEYRLTGIITVDDIMDVIEEEATEDFQKMAAMEPTDDDYLDTPVLKLAKHRITWLLILMISGTFTGAIIRGYEDVLSKMTVLSMFIPMLMDTGGNAGSQSSTLIIRGLAVGDIQMKDIFKVLRKETMIAILVGIALSFVNFLRLILIERIDSKIALVVSITLVFTVLMAKLVGGMLPIFAKKLKLDPAIMAGPLITTLVDAGSLMIYFKFSTILLGLR